ncbi:uncharacterized protein LOC124301744 [Neodiprion virginianus]|uniref:uncharacterized protein LOC124301744 n=1 Tax=Neodiprion virginianus TaxID=2961670 RepID=UPI001EE73A86|nr:uncharacterized protein LOC124301744 [Neodiprion virginianus]
MWTWRARICPRYNPRWSWMVVEGGWRCLKVVGGVRRGGRQRVHSQIIVFLVHLRPPPTTVNHLRQPSRVIPGKGKKSVGLTAEKVRRKEHQLKNIRNTESGFLAVTSDPFLAAHWDCDQSIPLAKLRRNSARKNLFQHFSRSPKFALKIQRCYAPTYRLGVPFSKFHFISFL